MKLRNLMVATAIAVATASSATAAVITKTFNFTAHDFTSIGVSGATTPPMNIVIGSITVSFDDNINVQNATSGILVNNLNINQPSTMAYNYVSNSDRLTIGGLAAGANVLTGGVDDFFLTIINASRDDYTFGYFYYSEPGKAIWATNQFSDSPSAVPEPATWAMMIIGFGAAGSMMRTSRRRSALSAA